MTTSDEYWSIDFLGTDEEKAEELVKVAERLGLASSAIIADPEAFLTLHLDEESVDALDSVLSQNQSSGDDVLALVDTLREVVADWRSARSQRP